MQAEKVSLDTSGAQGLLLGSLSLDLGLFGGGETASEGGAANNEVNIDVASYVNVSGSPLTIQITDSESNTTPITINASGSFTFNESILDAGEAFSLSIISYTGGQNCSLAPTSGIAGTTQFSVECERHLMTAAAFQDSLNSLHNLRLIRVNQNTLAPVASTSIVSGQSVPATPELIWNPDQSHYLLLWQTVSGSNRVIRAATYNIDGSQASAPINIYSRSNATIRKLAADWNPSNSEYIVVWDETISGASSIRYMTVKPDLSVSIAAVDIAAPDSSNNRNPDVSWTGSHYLIAFANDYYWQVYVYRILADGTNLGNSLAYSNGSNVMDFPAFVKSGSCTGLFFSEEQNISDTISARLHRTSVNSTGGSCSADSIVYDETPNCTVQTGEGITYVRASGVYTGTHYLLTWDHICVSMGFQNNIRATAGGAPTFINNDDFPDSASGSSLTCRNSACYVFFGVESNGASTSFAIHDTDTNASLGGTATIMTYGGSIHSPQTVSQ
jgi:hypothetical protein